MILQPTKKINSEFGQLDFDYMQEALLLAQEAGDKGEIPVGCVVVDNSTNAIIAKAYNLRECNKNAVAHAELLAIEEACRVLGGWRLSGCTLYVTLEPCFMCAGSIVLARIPRVVFAATDSKTGAVVSLAQVLTDSRLNHQCLVEYGLEAERAGQLLRSFFRDRRK